MIKVAALLWIILGTMLAGIAMAVIVAVPALSGQAAQLIPVWCGAGFVLAVPLSIVMARRIVGGMAGQRA
jgi:hypothetical protein